ncbi:MAG TPA: YIP1 family protein [Thermoanaerobaculia bacterium]|nr:YIP1 family protein [Thermoanaerobaculia bacterium]
MTEEVSASVPPVSPAPEVSAVAAVGGVFTRPDPTFAALVRRPTWWLPFVAGLLIAALFSVVMTDKIDQDAAMRRAIEKKTARSGQTMPKEQMDAAVDRAVEMQRKMAPFAPTFGAAAFAFFFFLAALVLAGAGSAFGGEAKIPAYLAIYAYAGIPTLVRSAISVGRLYAAPDTSLTYDDLARIGTVGPALLLPKSAAPMMVAIASSFDVFLLATVALLVVAFRRIPGLSKATATALPIALWALVLLVRVGWAVLFA